jgi:hypothetical protein
LTERVVLLSHKFLETEKRQTERAAAGLFACTSPPQTKEGSYDILTEPLPFLRHSDMQ